MMGHLPPLRQFQRDAQASTRLAERRDFVRTALHGYEATRLGVERSCRDWNQACQEAAQIKWQALEGLDHYLEQFADNLERNGAHVYWAPCGQDAVDYVLNLVRDRRVRSVVKSKTMTSEEIHLNEALESAGVEVVETDLGEFIVQLRHEPPYHFVFPAMHLKRGEISELFQQALASPPTSDPEALTEIARGVLRQKYLSADLGISGANFGVAETGMISITENEGNARLTCALPRMHVVLMGIEKIVPTLEDLALLLPMLATAGTGQHLTAYNSLYSGPRRSGEHDGPQEMHVILLDNHRSTLLADGHQRDALRCIRCGACLNVCPIFKNVGGFTYGTTYQGPIGSVITPHLRGLKQWSHLSQASSLCGACSATCPVGIDLHHHLLRNRQDAFRDAPKLGERLMYGLFRHIMTRPWLYRWASVLRHLPHWIPRALHGSRIDPVRGWRLGRRFPEAEATTFKQYWRDRRK